MTAISLPLVDPTLPPDLVAILTSLSPSSQAPRHQIQWISMQQEIWDIKAFSQTKYCSNVARKKMLLMKTFENFITIAGYFISRQLDEIE